MAYTYPIDEFVTLHGRKQTKRVHITAKTRDEFNAKLADWVRRLDAGELKGAGMTVREWAERWLEDTIKPRQLTAKSYGMYPSMLDNYILPAIGDIRLQSLTKSDCQRVINRMGRHAESYQHKCRIVLQGLIRAAYDDERIDRDVSRGITLSPTAAATQGRRPITDAERVALERVCYMPVLRDGKPNDSGGLYLMMLYCGLRPGECAALKKTDLDFASGFVTVRGAKERGSNKMKAPKTAAGFRTVPMTPDFARWLQVWLIAHSTNADCPYVFAQRDRITPLTDSSMQRRWETYKKYLDIELGAEIEYTKPGRKKALTIKTSVIAPDLVPYCLRHTYATNLVLYGVDRFTLTYIMGHTDPSVTQQYYVHIGAQHLKEAKKRMEEYRKTHTEVLMSDIAAWGIGDGTRERLQRATAVLQAIDQGAQFGRTVTAEDAAAAMKNWSEAYWNDLQSAQKEVFRATAKANLGDYTDTDFEQFWDAFTAKQYTNPIVRRYMDAILKLNKE